MNRTNEIEEVEANLNTLDAIITADKLETNLNLFYIYGDNFLAEEIVQLARHYQDVTGTPYTRSWDYGHTLGR